jgi:hypothetical protein
MTELINGYPSRFKVSTPKATDANIVIRVLQKGIRYYED